MDEKPELIVPTLLIVTDDQGRADRLINAFSPEQYQFSTVLSLDKAFQPCSTIKPDLAMVWLPFTSPEVLIEFKQLIVDIQSVGVTEKLPILLIIDQDGSDLVIPAFNLGVTDILTRPIHPLVLKQRVKMLIASKRTEDAIDNYQTILKELRLEEEKLRLIADYTYDWEYWIGHDGSILYNSPACERITGYAAKEIIDDPELLIRMVHPEDTQKVMDHYKDEKTSESSLMFEFRIIKEGKGEVWIDHACQPVFGDDKRPLGRRVSNRDSTNRKATEQALIRSERLAVVGRLVASLAHEINNPLQAISSCVDLISEYSLSKEETQQNLKSIQEEINRLTHISRRILDFSRPGKTKLVKIDVRDVLQQELRISKKQIEHARIVVQTNFPETIPEVLASADELGQVILNLIINAIESMDDGGKIMISVNANDPMVEISISDTGKGIPEDQLTSIFDPFFSTKAEGTGLGLAVSSKIIERFGGMLTAESQVNQGSVFKISLPISKDLLD